MRQDVQDFLDGCWGGLALPSLSSSIRVIPNAVRDLVPAHAPIQNHPGFGYDTPERQHTPKPWNPDP
jgi:hypothetical protein